MMSENQDQYNRGGFVAFMFSMVAVFGLMFYLVVIHPGVDLGENVVDPNQEGAAEGVFDIASVTEPWVSTPEMITYGDKIYQINCALCHGAQGAGDGAAGAGLNPKPRNLIEGKWTKGGGYIGLYNVLTEGIAGGSMGSYAHFKPADRWALVHYVQSITQNKIEEDPAKVAEFAQSAK